jgi:hypothetical protein
VSLPGGQMKGMRAGFALPAPGAVLGTQTFAEWLHERDERPVGVPSSDRLPERK